MAKTQRSKLFTIYPYLGVKTGSTSKLHYLNIKITNTKDKPIDIGIYFKDERIKVEKRYWNVDEHSITGGFPKDKIDNFNSHIALLCINIKAYIDQNPTEVNREGIEQHIGLQEKNKNQRVKHITLPVYESFIEKEFESIFNPMKRQIHDFFTNKGLPMLNTEKLKNSITESFLMAIISDDRIDKYFGKDSIDFEGIEFVREYYPQISDLLLFKKIADIKRKYPRVENEANEFLKDQRNYYSKGKNTLTNTIVKEYISLSKKEVDNFKKTGGNVKDDTQLIGYKHILDYSDKFNLQKKKERSPLEIYESNDYDNKNIFNVVGQILFLKKTKFKGFSKNWKSLVKRLFDYRSRAQPKELVKDFNYQWVDDFISFMKENGYSTSHGKNFNPFSYDANQFKGELAKYNDVGLQKFVKNTKEVFSWLMIQEHLPTTFNIKKIDYANYNLENVKQDTKVEFYLTKPEIDKLFFYDFKDLKEYSKKQLSQARDLFICQFYFGGLRSDKELLQYEINILDDGYGGKKVSYLISKATGETNENPICSYSELILKKYNFDFEKMKMDYDSYSKILKFIGKKLFDRKIIKYEQFDGKIKKTVTNVNVEFTSYFARRSFEQVLNIAGVNEVDATAYTGREIGRGSSKHYRNVTYQQKREVMEKITPIKS